MTDSVFSKFDKSKTAAAPVNQPQEQRKENEPAQAKAPKARGIKTSIYPPRALLDRGTDYAKRDVDLGRGFSQADVLSRLAMLGSAILELSGRDDVPPEDQINAFAATVVNSSTVLP